jgi:hypothetical protein
MSKLKRAPGLIRYDSLRGLAGEARRVLRPRLWAYALLGTLGLTVASFAFRARTPFEANLLRLPGAAFSLEAGGREVRNGFELHLVNKQGRTTRFELRPESFAGMGYVVPYREVELPALGERRVPIFVTAPNDHAPRELRIVVRSEEAERVVVGKFVAPQ